MFSQNYAALNDELFVINAFYNLEPSGSLSVSVNVDNDGTNLSAITDKLVAFFNNSPEKLENFVVRSTSFVEADAIVRLRGKFFVADKRAKGEKKAVDVKVLAIAADYLY